MSDNTNLTERGETIFPMNLQLFAEDADAGDTDDFDFEFDDVEDTDDDAEESDTETEESDEDAEADEGNEDTETEQSGKSDASGGVIPESNALKVKYNGEEKTLTLEEAKVLAQKGMNYDKILQERDSLKNAREFTVLDALAKERGVTREEVLNALQATQDNALVASMVAKGVPEDVAREMVSDKIALRELKSKEQQAVKAQEDNRPWQELAEAYPELGRPGVELPDSVIEAIKKGASPLVAYTAYENAQLKAKLAAQETNAKTKQKSVGSVKPGAPGNTEDDFLSGFLG